MGKLERNAHIQAYKITEISTGLHNTLEDLQQLQGHNSVFEFVFSHWTALPHAI